MDVDERADTRSRRRIAVGLGVILIVVVVIPAVEKSRNTHSRPSATEREGSDPLADLRPSRESFSEPLAPDILSGRVLDPRGAPLRPVEVYVISHTATPTQSDEDLLESVGDSIEALGSMNARRRGHVQSTDAEGRFRFENARSGRYLILAVGPGIMEPEYFVAYPGREVTFVPRRVGTRFVPRLPSGKTPPSATIEFKWLTSSTIRTFPWTAQEPYRRFQGEKLDLRIRIDEDDVRLSGDASGTVSEWQRVELAEAQGELVFDLRPQSSVLGRVEAGSERENIRLTRVCVVSMGEIPPDIGDRELADALSTASDHSHDDRTFAICPAPDGDAEVIVGFGEGTPRFARFPIHCAGQPVNLSVELDRIDLTHEIEARLEGLEDRGFRSFGFRAVANHGGAARPVGCAAFVGGKTNYTLILDPHDVERLRSDAWPLELQLFAKSKHGDEAVARCSIGERAVVFQFR